jgi:hypothetical protein
MLHKLPPLQSQSIYLPHYTEHSVNSEHSCDQELEASNINTLHCNAISNAKCYMKLEKRRASVEQTWANFTVS